MYQGKFGQGSSRDGSQQNPQPKKRKRQPRLGGTIFYTLYFFLIAVFCLCTYLGFNRMDTWLVSYEAAQSDKKAQQVHTLLFTQPDWEALYTASGIPDTAYENADTYARDMTARTSGKMLTWEETDSPLPHERCYHICLDGMPIAAFTLTDENQFGEFSLSKIGQLPDWQLTDVSVFLERSNAYRIEITDGYSASVNGVLLDQSHIQQVTVPLAAAHLPESVSAPRTCIWEVSGLSSVPEVTVYDGDAGAVEMQYDEASNTFTQARSPISADQTEAAQMAAQTQALWFVGLLTDPAELSKYFAPSAVLPQMIQPLSGSHTFKNVTVSDYRLYAEDWFSVRIGLELILTAGDGASATHAFQKSMLFRKTSSGSWLCVLTTDDDLSKPVGKVRLTFMQEENPIFSGFFYTDSTELTLPVINAPDGKQLAGWARKLPDGSLELVFRPGNISLPAGTTLAPMTLYALYEDAAMG